MFQTYRLANVELNGKAEKETEYQDMVSIVKEFKTTIKTDRLNIINITYRQERLFKMFKVLYGFLKMVKASESLKLISK